MPNLQEHLLASRTVGAVTAGFQASRERDPFNILLEIIGGYIGGDLGGRLPDGIDPPTWPGHRSVGHAVVPNAIVWTGYCNQVPGIQQGLRTSAARLEDQARQDPDLVRALFLFAGAFGCRLLSGAVVGLPAGYLTHLAMDATTPRCLPAFG